MKNEEMKDTDEEVKNVSDVGLKMIRLILRRGGCRKGLDFTFSFLVLQFLIFGSIWVTNHISQKVDGDNSADQFRIPPVKNHNLLACT